MPYLRVIPRDLFNEANLLKCYGQLYLKLERYFSDRVTLHHRAAYNGSSEFDIRQNQNDGSLSIRNIDLVIDNQCYDFWRPLNSRREWPLYMTFNDGDDVIDVFDAAGELTGSFLQFVEKGYV